MITSFADPALEEFRVEVRRWLATAIPAEWRDGQLGLSEDAAHGIRRDWDRALHAAGYAGLSWPVEFGGRDAGPVVEVAFHEELARAGAPEGFGRIGRVMAGPIIMRFGTDEQRARHLPGILDGSRIWCLGFSEPGAGSDLTALSTRAERDGDGYRIHGTKIWTSYAHHADHCVLLARSDPAAPARDGITMLLLDMRQPGVLISPLPTIAGDRHFAEVTFDGAWVPDTERIGAENEGWAMFRGSLAFERGMSVALNHYLEMVRQVGVLGECCARGSARQAELAARVEVVRWHILRVTELDANGDAAQRERLVFKLYWSELAQELADAGQRLNCPTHRDYWNYGYLQSRSHTIYGGTSEIQRDTIARIGVLR